MDRGDIFDIIPSSVRSRISAFRSLRSHRRHSVSSSRHHQQMTRQVSEEFMVAGEGEDGILRADHTATEAGMETPSSTWPNATRLASGIRWNYAEQGMKMHISSAQYVKEDAGLARKSYIDGIAYMLTALPENITEQEAAVIREGLSSTVAGMIFFDGNSNSSGNGNGRQIGWKPLPEDRTVLQRGIACLVALFVVLLHRTLSFATVVVRFGADYERKHNISQHIASWGCVTATTVGSYGVVLSAKICAMKDGWVGKAVVHIANWTVENVASGIQEGIGQGLVMTDPKSKQAWNGSI